MRGNKKWVALAGLLALLWAPFVYTKLTREDPSMAKRATGDGDDPLDPTAASAPAPEAEPEPEPQPAKAAPADSPRAQAPPPPPPQMPATGHFGAMQRAFESETRDAAWASEQEKRIPRLLAEAGFPDDALDGQVTCRRTLCRFQLRVVENDMFALMKLAAKTQTEKGLALAYGAAEVVHDKTRVLVYVPREGASLEDLTAK